MYITSLTANVGTAKANGNCYCLVIHVLCLHPNLEEIVINLFHLNMTVRLYLNSHVAELCRARG